MTELSPDIFHYNKRPKYIAEFQKIYTRNKSKFIENLLLLSLTGKVMYGLTYTKMFKMVTSCLEQSQGVSTRVV